MTIEKRSFGLNILRANRLVKMEPNQNTKEIRFNDLQTGDLLFSSHPYCNLSQAIDLVTQTGKNTHYSHVGIVEKSKDFIFVYHSTSRSGVCCEPFELFMHPDEKENTITVYRLRKQFLQYIPQAVISAKNLLGEEYNHSFRFTSPGFYCSEFIYRIFAPGRIFELSPMTFRNPEDDQFSEHWIAYYQRLGITIPERQPGCNPNGMAASDKLELIGTLKSDLM